jgi:hypothetical protein
MSRLMSSSVVPPASGVPAKRQAYRAGPATLRAASGEVTVTGR